MGAIQPAAKRTAIQTQPPLERLIEDFLAAQDVTPASRKTYKRQLKQFVVWLQRTGRGIRMNIQGEDILEYKEHLLYERGLTPLSVSGYLTAVRKLYQWLESRKLYPDITRGIKGARKPKGFRRDAFTPSQLREALGAMDRSSLEGKRDFAIFNLMARTGLRTIEVARARVGDLRQQGGEAILWVHGKGRDEADEFVLLTDEALAPLRQYLSARGGSLADEASLFCSHSDRNKGQAMTSRSISRIVKDSLRAVSIDDKRLTAHSLRHTAISLAIQGGASLQQAQAMARHSDPKTTQIYFHNLDRITDGAEKCIHF